MLEHLNAAALFGVVSLVLTGACANANGVKRVFLKCLRAAGSLALFGVSFLLVEAVTLAGHVVGALYVLPASLYAAAEFSNYVGRKAGFK